MNERERELESTETVAAARAQVAEAQSEQVWVHAAYEWTREATRKPLPGGRRRSDAPQQEA